MAFVSHGVRGLLTWDGLAEDPDRAGRWACAAPPGSAVADPAPAALESRDVDWTGRVTRRGTAYELLTVGGGTGGVWVTEDADDLDHVVESAMGLAVAELARDAVSIHAGVVGTPAGAVILPGRSFAGKTTLVTALLAAGCAYLSDDYAVLSPDGRVVPYPRRLSVREGDGRLRPTAQDLGAPVGEPVLPVAVVDWPYVPGTPTRLTDCGQGAVAMALFDNAVAARTRPHAVAAACADVARVARGFAGVRGEAAAAAAHLLAVLTPPTPSPPTEQFREL